MNQNNTTDARQLDSALVIGGTAFLGRHTVAELLDHGYDVTTISRDQHGFQFGDEVSVEQLTVDRTDEDALSDVAERVEPIWAVAPATLSSLVLFGLYHLPLRGTFLVVIDASMVGVTFALAYLLTGELGLPLGVHFGRLSIELVTGFEILGVDVPAVLAFTRDTVLANLEVKLLELGVICLSILMWIYRTDGELEVSDSIYEQPDGDVDSG